MTVACWEGEGTRAKGVGLPRYFPRHTLRQLGLTSVAARGHWILLVVLGVVRDPRDSKLGGHAARVAREGG